MPLPPHRWPAKALATLLLGLLAAGPLARPAHGQADRLNVLWLSVEDMSPWIGPYGDTTVPTPHLDALAQRSLRFDNAFADSPVCAPARTALITGIYPTRMGAMHMRTRSRSRAAEKKDPQAYADIPLYEAIPPAFVRCFPEHLRRAGYFTSNRSKQDYQFATPPTVWDQSSGRAHYKDLPADQPFFAVFNHGGTHESRAFPDAKRTPELIAPEKVGLPPFYPDTPAVRDAMARTYNNIAAMDSWVGERLAELEASGRADETVIFFFSDHGVGLPRGKRSLYGTGVRVPLLIAFPEGRWPQTWQEQGWRRGGATDAIVSFIDFGPTVLEIAGLTPDPRLDGQSFLDGVARPLAFFHADRFDAVRDRTRAVTDGKRLLIHNLLPEVPHLIPNAYRERLPMTHDLYALRDQEGIDPALWQVASRQRPSIERYDSQRDPWEVAPLANDALNDEERLAFEELDRALNRWMEDTADLGLLTPEGTMVRERLWGPTGEQPRTLAPSLAEQELRAGQRHLRLQSATEGASIAWRTSAESNWQVGNAQDRFSVPETCEELQVVAHRLGYLRSELRWIELGTERK